MLISKGMATPKAIISEVLNQELVNLEHKLDNECGSQILGM